MLQGIEELKARSRTFKEAVDAAFNLKPRLNRQNFADRTIKRGAGRKALSIHAELAKRG